MKLQRIIATVSAPRALLETALLGCIVWGGLLVLNVYAPPSITRSTILFLGGPLCTLWCALRLRLPEQRRWRQYTGEIAIAGLLLLACGGMIQLLQLLPQGGLAPAPHWKHSAALAGWIALLLDGCTFGVIRIGIYLQHSWEQIRGQRLLWSFTHVQMTIIAIGVGVIALISEVITAITLPDLPLIVLTTLIFSALGVVLLAAIVPLAVLFSYLMIRRTIPRLRSLAAATSELRKGNYVTRIPVTGKDEVAQLQGDFNAMADDLERTMHDLQKERDTVAQLLQERRELIVNVSHELRTPMATLRSYLEITLAHWNGSPAETLQHNMQIMEHEVMHLQRLVDDLFTLSREEVGRLTLHCIPLDAGKLVQQIVATRAPLARQASRIELIVDIGTSIPMVQADARLLEQVLQNLLHNALRHTAPGGIVALAVEQRAGGVQIEVKDTGEGIASADLAHIWERFYQADNAHQRAGSGTGLGLALANAKDWIEAMNGTIQVTSILGEGSCFTMLLPAVI